VELAGPSIGPTGSVQRCCLHGVPLLFLFNASQVQSKEKKKKIKEDHALFLSMK
jgi:hypothetical protein